MPVDLRQFDDSSAQVGSNVENSHRGSLGDGRVLVGVNVVDLDRLNCALERTPGFIQHCFTEAEQIACKAMPAPQMGYASRFAAKIAVCKALEVDDANYIRPRSIEINQGTKGKPSAKLSGRIASIANRLGVLEIPLSFSYTHSEAAACAMAITKDSVSKAKERVDQKQELAKRFREARSVLDELPGSEPVFAQATLPGVR